MGKYLVSLLVIITTIACSRSNLDVNGPVYNVLKPSKYNTLQSRYTSLEDFENGTSKVKKQNYWGLINTQGKEILKTEYDTIYSLINNHRIVQKSSKYGLIDQSGKIVIPCKYDSFKEYHTNDTFAFQLNGKWGFLSSKNEIKVQFKYDQLHYIGEEFFVGELNGHHGMFDYSDQTIIIPEYDDILYRPFTDSKVSFVKKGDKYAIVNSKNEIVTRCEYPFTLPSGDYITIKNYIHKRFCLICWETGEILIPYNKYSELGDCVDGLLYACKNETYGYVNPNNEIVIPFKFADAEDFSEGLAMVGVVKGSHTTWWGSWPKKVYGFIDSTGEFVIQPKFANQALNPGNGFKEGLAVMGADNSSNIFPDKYGYIDKTGKWVISAKYTDADDFLDGVAIVQTNKGYGAIDKQGEWIVEPEYDDYDYRGWHKDKLVFKDKAGGKYEFTLNGEAL